MKLSKFISSLAFAWFALSTMSAQADTATILILRHGEKPSAGLGQLTCQGLNRSLALAPLLLARYGKPQVIYAPNPGVSKTDLGVPYAYIRPLATIEPLAIRVGMPVIVEGGMTDIEPLAARILTSPTGTHVVAWEHHWGKTLAKYLLSRTGGNPDDVPEWKDDDFDSIFVIRINRNEDGSLHSTFSHEQQGLNNLPESCSEGALRVPR